MKSIKICLTLVLLVFTTSCANQSTRIEHREELLPRVSAGSQLTCPVTDQNHCGIDSPLRDLADTLTKSEINNLHAATILDIGIHSLEARLHLIRAARESIEIQTYIWASDEIGYLFAKELIAAAKRGVKVRIIGDQLYSGNDPENLAKLAQLHENFQVKLYNPLHQKATSSMMDAVKGVFLNFGNLNHRMHNKLMVFDGRIGITGGRNIENAYYNWDEEYNFLDRDVLVVGPVAKDMQESFNRYWLDPVTVELDQLSDVREHLFKDGKQQVLPELILSETNEFDEVIKKAIDSHYISKTFIDTSHSVSDIEFIADRPQKPFIKDEEADLSTTKNLRQNIENARSSMLMQTPYFIISDPAYKLFKKLRKDKPEINLTVSTNSLASIDQYIIYALSFKRKKRNVKELGFNIFELKPVPDDIEIMMPRYSKLANYKKIDNQEEDHDLEDPAGVDRYETVPVEIEGPRVGIHSKSIVIDGEVAVIGSHNFDPRGIGINTEVTLTIRDKAFASELSDSINQHIKPQNSWTIAKRLHIPVLSFITESLESVSRLLPVFDIWPFRYTTSFELRDGEQPVPPDHPEFYERYNNVGQFPGTTMSDDQLKTILVSGFGAIAEPLM
jgi:cardiolipin synthase C